MLAGVSADEAAKEWAANVVPGITIIPSGTWGVNRAQKAAARTARRLIFNRDRAKQKTALLPAPFRCTHAWWKNRKCW
jgi:hypothetical protein